MTITKPRFVFLRSIFALMIREMTTTYGRSPGGYIWTFVEPVGGIALLTLIFAMISRTPPLGNNFQIYFAAGILPFMMYTSTASKVSSAIRYSRPLLAYPSVTYIDTIVGRLLLNALTQIMIAVIMISMIVLIYDVDLHLNFLICVRAATMAFALGLGVGLANCYLMSMLPVWQSIWGILNRPLFIISGIFFLLDPLPEKLRSLLLLNPLAHAIMEMRNGIFDIYDAPYASPTYVYIVALCLTAIGMLVLHRYHRQILDEGL